MYASNATTDLTVAPVQDWSATPHFRVEFDTDAVAEGAGFEFSILSGK